MSGEEGGAGGTGGAGGGPPSKKGAVTIQRVERDLKQVTRRYVLLVLAPSADPCPSAELLEALRRTEPPLAIRRRAAGSGGGGGGNGDGDRAALDVREGLLLEQGDATAQLEFYAFADCPWFDGDAPPGPWQGVYEVVGDVALQDKDKDPRYGLLRTVADTVLRVAGGATFDLQEWKLLPPRE